MSTFTLDHVHRDDTPAEDLLRADLRARQDRATATDPILGTVELTVWELGHLLDLVVRVDASRLAHEFTTGQQSRVTRRRNATIAAIEEALVGQSGPLADTIAEIVRRR